MLLAWPWIPGGKPYFINGWVGKNGGGSRKNGGGWEHVCRLGFRESIGVVELKMIL